MHDPAERRVWIALQQKGIGAASIAALDFVYPDNRSDLALWACVIAATPRARRWRNTPLRTMAARMPSSEVNPDPALSAVKRLANALKAGDDHSAVRAVAQIRHYTPATDRQALFDVVRDLNNCDKYKPGAPRAGRLFDGLLQLLSTFR